MLGVLGFESLAPLEAVADVRADPEAEELRLRRDDARGARATSRRPTGCATSCQEQGFEVRDGPDGSELIPRW